MLGDVVGEPGRRLLRERLPDHVASDAVDFVVVNGENVAGGAGITAKLHEKLLDSGVDVVTTGDHAFRRRDSYPTYEASDRLLRPANLGARVIGRGVTVVQSRAGVPVAVVNLIGRVFLDPAECPFEAADQALDEIGARARVILVDMHAEATSEKKGMGWHLDGRVSAVVGTHTHVATADEEILPQRTGYVTDLGMTGPHRSVLGRRVDDVLARFRTNMPQRLEVAEEYVRSTGVTIDIDEATGRATAIRRTELS